MLRDRGFLADLVVRDRVVVFSAAANRGRNTVPTLTYDMKRAITEIHLCYVATVTPEGRPNLSPKGSLRVWDDDHVVFADIASPRTVGNVAANPYVEINIVNPFPDVAFDSRGELKFSETARNSSRLPAWAVVRSLAQWKRCSDD